MVSLARAAPMTGDQDPLLAMTIYLAVVAVFIAATLLASHVIGPRRRGGVKGMPYESGVDPVGQARSRVNPRFYLIALAFLLFDVLLAFVYPWAKLLGGNELQGAERRMLLVGMIGFAGWLVLAYLYAWVKGALKWS